MAIKRWDPVRNIREMQTRMNELFDSALAGSEGTDAVESAAHGWTLPMDLFEEQERYVLLADLPGVAASDVDLKVENGVLHLRGERKTNGNISKESYLRVERPHGRFAVQVSLPPSVDPQGVRASQSNGVIEITLPKRKRGEPSKIEISSS